MMNLASQRKHFALALLGASLVCAPARAGAIWIAWDSKGAFEQAVQVAPGEFVEVCGKLVTGQAVGWSFASASKLNFDVHYHVDKDTVYSTKKDEVAKLEGELKATIDQTYCWTWTNKTSAAASVKFRMAKQPSPDVRS